MKCIYIGIDPGKNGGICLIANGYIEAVKMPETERDIYEKLKNYKGYGKINMCLIEKVHSHPKDSAKNAFKFGWNYGGIRAFLIALDIPFDEISPYKWQKKLNCLTKGNKNITKAKAQQLYPQLKITHATADAVLIAHYAKYYYKEK